MILAAGVDFAQESERKPFLWCLKNLPEQAYPNNRTSLL